MSCQVRETTADLGENVIPDSVSARVVHLLKIVEIEHDERHRAPGCFRLPDGTLEGPVEMAAVGQARKIVKVGSLPKSLRGLLFQCDVLEHAEQPHRLAVAMFTVTGGAHPFLVPERGHELGLEIVRFTRRLSLFDVVAYERTPRFGIIE